MGIALNLAIGVVLAGCAASLERQTSAVAKDECRQQGEAYARANMARIAIEWRHHEKYERYRAWPSGSILPRSGNVA